MITFDQELAGRYIDTGAARPSLDDRRVARVIFVRATTSTVYHTDQEFGIDPADRGCLAEPVDAAEEHLELISHEVGQRSVATPPTVGGETA